MADRPTVTKVCRICRTAKPLADFKRAKKRKDKRMAACGVCIDGANALTKQQRAQLQAEQIEQLRSAAADVAALRSRVINELARTPCLTN